MSTVVDISALGAKTSVHRVFLCHTHFVCVPYFSCPLVSSHLNQCSLCLSLFTEGGVHSDPPLIISQDIDLLSSLGNLQQASQCLCQYLNNCPDHLSFSHLKTKMPTNVQVMPTRVQVSKYTTS